MAVHLATGSDYLQRTASLLPHASNSTVMLWVRFNTVAVLPAYQTPYIIMDSPGTYTDYVAFFGDTTDLRLDGNMTPVTTTPPVAGRWYHLCWTQSGTTQRFYVNGVSIGTSTYNRAAVTVGDEFLGNDTLSAGNLDAAYFRSWNTALTGDQVLVEMQSASAVHTANLWMDTPLVSDLNDISGNGRNWTQVGSGSFVAGPVWPANSTALTATPIGTLPQTITQSFDDGVTMWFSYTGHPTEVIAGFFAFTAIPTDTIETTVYEADGVTTFGILVDNVPFEVPQTSGTTVLFQVSCISGRPSTDLTFSALPGPTSPTPIGAIFTNDDAFALTGVVSPTNGANYQVLQFFNFAVTASENGGDVLENGRVLVASDEDLTLRLYNGQLSLLVTVAGITTTGTSTCVRTCVGAQVFYMGIGGGGPSSGTVYRIDGDGVKTHTWTLPSAGITGLAASNDESIIYVIGQSSPINAPIKQWNPNTNSFGADLVAGVGTNYVSGDLLVMGDDSILAIYHRISGGGTNLFIRRYNAAGATLNTYNFTTTDGESSLFHAIDDPTSFWVRVHNEVGDETCTFYNIKASDGSILSTVTQSTFEGGVYSGSATASPPARFGLSLSCPSFILREAINPPTPTPGENATEYLIRRERWFPVVSHEQHRQFFSKLKIDMQAGNGLGGVPSTTVGFNPIMEFDWSSDGGWTWSSIRFVETGKVGAYGWQPTVWRMPYGRDRVYRIAVSDPNQWVVVNGYLDAVLGTI